MDDPLQNLRIKLIIEGKPDLNLIGLLQLVRDNQSSDSCRSYQCIKTLVNASNKSLVVKEYLLQDSDRWQWSVNWLKSKMTDYGTYYSPSVDSMLSNEDPTTRTFHRYTVYFVCTLLVL